MGHDRAIAILREHAGTQWDPRIVTAVAALTEHDTTGIFGNVGHSSAEDVDGVGACSCVDALPETVQALLV